MNGAWTVPSVSFNGVGLNVCARARKESDGFVIILGHLYYSF